MRDDPPADPPTGIRGRWLRRPYRRWIVAVCALALVTTVVTVYISVRDATTAQLTVPVSESTYVVRESPNTSFANRRTLQAANLEDEHALVYLKFVVPPFATHVTDAHLRLHTAAAATGRLSLHVVSTNSWRATTTSYHHRPDLGQMVTTTEGPSTIGDWVDFDIAKVINGPGTYSFAVASTSTKAVFAAYAHPGGTDSPQLGVGYRTANTQPGRSYAQGVQTARQAQIAHQGPLPTPGPSGSSASPSGPVPVVSGSPGSPVDGPTPTSGGGGGSGGGGPTPTPSPPGGGVVPAGPTLCGAYYETPSGDTYLQGLNLEQGRVGDLDSVRVFNTGAPPAWPGSAGSLNRTVIVSFKFLPSQVLSGSVDAHMRSWFSNAPRDRDVYWTYFHEPEDDIEAGSYNATDYRAAWRHLAALAKSVGNPRLYATLILMQWSLMPQSGRDWRNYYPGSDVIDVLGWDVYNMGNGSGKYTTPATLTDPVIAASRSVGKPFGVGELGAKQAATDTTGNARATWLRTIVSQLRAGNALWIEYFDADKSNAGRYDWRLRDGPSQSAWRQFCSS